MREFVIGLSLALLLLVGMIVVYDRTGITIEQRVASPNVHVADAEEPAEAPRGQ